MKKKNAKKLSLRRETIRTLGEKAQEKAAGGVDTDQSDCTWCWTDCGQAGCASAGASCANECTSGSWGCE